MERQEAVTVVKELIDSCVGLDGHSFELAPPNIGTSVGYQIIIRTALDDQTKACVRAIVQKHSLAYQTGSMWKTRRSLSQEPDTLIIYKPKTAQ